MSEQSQDGQQEQDAPTRGPRRLAEWVSFGVSLVLVLALCTHLLWRLREPTADAVPTQVTVQLDRVSEQQGRFVLPIEVKNLGSRSVRELQLRVEYDERGERRSLDVSIDYVGQSAGQRVFVYFTQDPRGSAIRAEPISYLVD